MTRAIKLTQNCVCFASPVSILFRLSSLVNTTPSYLNLPTTAVYCWPLADTQFLGLLSAIFLSIPAWSHGAENQSTACWSLCSEDASSNKSSANPATSNSDTLVCSALTVYPSMLVKYHFFAVIRSRTELPGCWRSIYRSWRHPPRWRWQSLRRYGLESIACVISSDVFLRSDKLLSERMWFNVSPNSAISIFMWDGFPAKSSL